MRRSLSARADLLGDLLGDVGDDDGSPKRKRRKKKRTIPKQMNIKMKEINELNQRMDSNDEIVDSLVKRIQKWKQVAKITENSVPSYSVAIDTILIEIREIKQTIKQNDELTLLKQIFEKLSKLPTSATKQLRVLLLP